jgi:hypothetical protein
MGRTAETLGTLDNPDDISRMVVLDNWLLNCDRHPPDLASRRPNHDNVFLSGEGARAGHFRLIAMDHGHCFTCGRELNGLVATIEKIRDERVYGLFPAFRPLLREAVVRSSIERLAGLDALTVERAVDAIPIEWDVSPEARFALKALILDRAMFLSHGGGADAFATRLLG